MPEIREVKSQIVDQKCSFCGNGYMRPDGIVNMTNPQTYQHQCTSCGKKMTYNVRYPYSV